MKYNDLFLILTVNILFCIKKINISNNFSIIKSVHFLNKTCNIKYRGSIIYVDC
jgi:hypothetical protein